MGVGAARLVEVLVSTTALPRTLGKYRPIALIARGGMGNAYLALVNGAGSFNKLVVLKVLKPDFAEDQEFLAMFRDEARIAANLNHPNVVQTHEFGVQDEHFFIAMDFVDGQPLRLVRKRLQEHGALSLGAHLRILVDVLEGLQYAHDLCDHDGTPLHLVHRDVSPHNIMVSYEGHAKLLDFGIAKAKGSSHQTTTGVLKGKVGYMAPEQARCEALDHRADIFPVGVLMWEAIVGGRMWGNLTDVQVLAQLVRREIPPLPDLVDGKPIPEVLRAIVAKATAAECEDRYPSARAFAAELETYVDTLPRAETSARALAELRGRHFGTERDKRRRVVDDAIRQVRAASSTAEYPAMLGLTSSGGVPSATHTSTAGHTLAMLQGSGTPSQPSLGSINGLSQLSQHESSPGTLTPSTSAPFVAPLMGQHGTYSGMGHTPSFAPPYQPLPPSPSPVLKIGLAAVGAVILFTGIGVFALRGKSEGTASPQPSATVPVESSVRLELVVSSGSAKPTAFLDGREVAVGGEVRMPRDSADHTLKVRAEGFKEHVESLKLDKDQRISLRLDEEPTAAAPVPVVPHTSAVAVGGGHHANYVPPKAPPVAPPTTPATVAPQPTAPQPTAPAPASTPKRPDRPIIEVLK
jgi:serine/threonine-protein kinase